MRWPAAACARDRSKNTKRRLEAIDHHPGMPAAEEFAAWRINGRQAANIADLAAELRLGLQSVVFIDDNPVERARVAEALPEVLVPAWPRDPMLYAQALRALDCFDTLQHTAEDVDRARAYANERERRGARARSAKWRMAARLDTRVKIDRWVGQLQRAAHCSTNQQITQHPRWPRRVRGWRH